MRSFHVLALGSLIAAATFGLVACAAAEDDSEAGGADLTGGSGGTTLDAPVVYFFTTRTTGSRATKCVGALLSDTVAVTSKDCPSVGMTLGANGANDNGTRSTVTAVHVPDGANADIALVEINPPISGAHAVIAHAPLRDGYTITATQSAASGGFFMPQKGDPSSINGRLFSETDTQSLLQPDTGSQICAGDLGAPVCAASHSNFGGTDVSGTCSLAGVVLGPVDGAAAADGGIPADAGSSVTMVDGVRCSGNAWKVAQLGRHAAFIKQFAPQAFKPITVDNGLFGFGSSSAVPDGLWGYKTGGDIKECQITTAALPPTAVSSPVSLTATVSFANMQQNAVGVGRFGIAPANAPTQMTWFAAQGSGHKKQGFSGTFSGTIAGATDGDYIVAFRASANGGETWTECDIDGISNGFDAAKALPLKVGAGGPVGTTPAPTTTALPDGGTTTTTPAATTPSTDVSDPNSSSDPGPSDTSGDSDAGTTAAPKKKKSGCATSPVGTGTGDAPAYAGLGAALGLAALLRGRRRATKSS